MKMAERTVDVQPGEVGLRRYESCPYFLRVGRSKKKPICSSGSTRIELGLMGVSYRKASQKELSVGCIKRENRLPKERVGFLSFHRSRERQKNYRPEQL